MYERLCLSCEKPILIRAKEHVIPEWLLTVMDVQYEQVIQAIAAGSEEQVRHERRFTFDSFQEGRLCKLCNCGWMGDLESRTKPLLVPLIGGDVALSSLSDSETLLVARWAAKTAIVLSNCIELRKPAPAGSLQFLKENEAALPPRFGVFGCQQPERTGTRRFAYLQRNSWRNASIDGAPNYEEEMVQHAFKVSFQFRCLSLLTAFLPLAQSSFLIAAGLHIPLWPAGPIFAAHKISLEGSEPHDSFDLLKVFTHTPGAVHPRSSGAREILTR